MLVASERTEARRLVDAPSGRPVLAVCLTFTCLFGGPCEVARGARLVQPAGAGQDQPGPARPESRADGQLLPDVVIRLGVIPNEMLFSTTELTVRVGQLIEVAFTNDDQVQHNFALGSPDSLEVIGAAADALALRPDAAAMAYVPDIVEVLVKTPLVDVGQTLTFRFRAPDRPGKYPYVCTFPAHWRVMNGTLDVIE